MLMLRSFNQFIIKKQSIKLYSVCVIPYKINQNSPKVTSKPYLTSPHLTQTRNFSLNATIESIIQTPLRIFTAISESTPVSHVQNFILDVHSFTGLPWWASIMFTTILLRTFVTFPLAIHQNMILAKVENLKLELPAIAEEMKKEMAVAVHYLKWTEPQAKAVFRRSMKKQWDKLVVRDNCHPFKASLLLWIQLPMWIFFSVSIRNLTYMLPKKDADAAITFLELSLGGTAWFPNLIMPDSTLILPVALGLINLLIIEIQVMTKLQNPTKFQQIVTNLFRGLSLIMIPVAASVPSCLTVYWTTSSTLGLLHNLILLSPGFKRLTKIPKTKIELQNPYTHIRTKLGEKFSFKKSEKVV